MRKARDGFTTLRVAEAGRLWARKAVGRDHVFRPEHPWAGRGQDPDDCETASRRIGRVGLALLVLVALAACNPKPPNEANYVDRIAAARAAKDAQFLKAAEPVPAGRKTELLPLEYFPINPAYDVPAVLKPFAEMATVDMPTSTGTVDKMRRVGSLEFVLHGEPMKLTAFVPAASPNLDSLFVPFSDLTSGGETYQSGRYLDLDRTATGIYQIDFNLGYNPYCYFSPVWVCPIPPRENRLPARIEAGERIKSEKGEGKR